jgi:hypothetical protein
MARTKGAKNKPVEIPRRVELLDDILTIAEVAHWLKVGRLVIEQEIESGTIPEDCYFKVGREYKMIKRKIAVLKGILPAA